MDGGYRATDSFEVFPKIERRSDAAFRCRFFLHGWRHVSETAQQRLQSLKPDEKLHVAIELTSPTTDVAVQIQTRDYYVLGWSPRYLVSDLVSAIAKSPGDYEAHVVQVNPVPAPAKQRLLVELRGHWPEHDPMTKNDFEPLFGLGLKVSIRVQDTPPPRPLPPNTKYIASSPQNPKGSC